MKALSMAISSPGRPEKFPRPSNKFSRSSTGGRSSRPPRSAPVSHRRNGAGMIASGDQEPCSPKVTCIGQVRPRKSGCRRRRCWLWGRLLSGRRGFLRRVLCKWAVVFRSGYCKKVDAVAEEDHFGGRRGRFRNLLEIRVGGNGKDSPPRRKDSPYRGSSALGERFWRENGVLRIPVCEDGVAAESGIRQESSEIPRNNDRNLGDSEGMVVHPLMLTRCKSEPARVREVFELE